MKKNKSARRTSKKYSSSDAFIKKALAEKYGVERQFVYYAIKGERESDKALEIKREYQRLKLEIRNIIKT